MKTRQSSKVTRGAYMVGLALPCIARQSDAWQAQPYRYARLLALVLGMTLLALTGRAHAVGTGTLDYVSGWYPSGTNLTVTATPHLYSQFDRWEGSTNGAVIAANQLSFDVDGGRLVRAVFRDGVTASNAVPYEWLGTIDSTWTNDFEVAATNDPDGDGFTTWQEYWSGTDPTNSDSLLQIDNVVLSGTNLTLFWAHARVDGSNIPPICIQARSSMTTGQWSYAGEKLPIDGTNTWDASGPQQGFYRLCVTNMP